jgi:4-hydroxy-tetrahydrodipicolinate synthase
MGFVPKGIVVPVVTPLKPDGSFNEPVYRQLIEHLARAGVHGVFPFGTTGEFYAFDDDAYRHVLEVTMDAVAGRMHVYAGANHITTRGTIAIARVAEQVGVDALSVLTPMFISQSQQELYDHYRAIAQATCLPIVIYNNKPKTNVTVAPETVARLAEIPNIVGVKDSTGDMTNTEEYIRLTRHRDDFHVLMGRDTLIYAALCYGASGAIASCANVAPRVAVEIYERHLAGDAQGALEAQFKLSMLRMASNMGTFPVVIKEGLQLLGIDVGRCVEPIAPLSSSERARLREVLVNMELL